MDRFFRGNPPRKGEPVSKRGFASGVMAMANALSNMQVHGGHVEWSAWLEPTIVIDPLYLQKNSYGTSGTIPDGTVIYGRVVWSATESSFLQYYLGYTSADGWTEYSTLPTWSAAAGSFSASASSTIIAKFANIYGPVEYSSTGDKLVQYPLVWDSTTSAFIKGDTPVDVYEFPDEVEAIPDDSERYGRIEWDSTGNYLKQYKEVYDQATNTWTEKTTATVSISTESHSSQHT